MRLLYVIHQFFPDCHSGTEQHCLAAAREARRRGHDVTVLSLHWDHDRQRPPVRLFEQPYDGFRVLRLNHWRGLNPNDVLRDYDNRHLEGWFRHVLDDVQPAAVHFFHLRQLGSNLIAVARRHGARTIASLTDFWFVCPRFTLLRTDGALCEGPPDGGRGCVRCEYPELADTDPADGEAELRSDPDMRLRALLDRPRTQLERLHEVDAIFAPSRFLGAMFERNGLQHRNVHAVPYGLEPDRIAPLPATRPRHPMRFAFCGVLSPWKGPDILVRAVRESTAEIDLRIHGRLEEPMFADFIAATRAAAGDDPRIRFMGPYDGSAAPRVFAEMDVLVVPSTWYENTPFVVLEAFAAGIPVIASDLGGMSEVVHDGKNGFLFPAGDAEALRGVIERVAGDPDLYATLRPDPPTTIAQCFDAFEAQYRA